MGCLFLLKEIFLTQGSNLSVFHLLHWQADSLRLVPSGKPHTTYMCVYMLRYADDTTLMTENEEELKSLWMKVKKDSEIVGWKLNIQKTKIMASSPITWWEIDWETESDFIFWGSKITADGDCSHEIKRCLFLGRKVMTNLDSTFRDSTKAETLFYQQRSV